MEREVSPPLPTSGQIFGSLVKNLGIRHALLQSRTARRFFSGRLEQQVKESTRAEIIGAIAEVLSDIGLAEVPRKGDDDATPAAVLADLLDWHGVNWERWRDFMRPRMMRVLPSHLSVVWAAYVRLAVIDLAIRIAGKVHMAGAAQSSLDFLAWASSSRRGRYLNRKRMESGIRVHQAEENELIQELEGRLLQDWDVGNPEAYAHYQRSIELQVQGRIYEAVAEVAKAAELDPLDPAKPLHPGVGETRYRPPDGEP